MSEAPRGRFFQRRQFRRVGHATTAACNGAPDRTIIRQTGHKRTETLDTYVRTATVFVDNSADYLDLDGAADQPSEPSSTGCAPS